MKIKLTLFLNVFLISGIYAQQQLSDFSYKTINKDYPDGFIEYKDLIYFNASTDGAGREIWRTDGSSQNTELLKDILPGNGNGALSGVGESSTFLNGELYFLASDENYNKELWKTDGTTSGTKWVADLNDGDIGNLTTVGNNIFFLSKPDDFILQVWKSDGTSEGTVLVKDNISIWNDPTFEGKCNDIFIFTFQDCGTNDSRVWRSDGTTNGTYPITGALDGNGSGPGGTSALTQYIENNNKLYFVSRYYLHETDGTLGNTKTVAKLWQASTNLVEYSDVIVKNNKLYFLFFSSDNYQLSIWESDGTGIGTSEIYYVNEDEFYLPSNLAETSNALIFCTTNGTGGTSLVSLNLMNYDVSYISELTTVERPYLYGPLLAGRIYPVSSEEYLICLPISFQERAFITNLATNTTEHHSELDHTREVFIYNQEIYFSYDYQLWKYSQIPTYIEEASRTSFSIYPNPTSDYIELGSSLERENINIYDLNGRQVISIKDSGLEKIDVTGLSKGVYIMECVSNGVLTTKKFIKE